MVSEDSDHLGSGFLAVHRLCDLGDLDQTVPGQMSISADQLEAAHELLEVSGFRGPERVLPEEWNDHFQQIASAMDRIQIHVLAVVVVPCVHVHTSDSEELTQLVEHADASRALHHDEVVIDLVAGSVALSVPSVRLPDEADGEAAFSVYETSNPCRVDQSFLLIAWLIARAMNASRIVARHFTTDIGSSLSEHRRILQVFQHLVGFL